MTARQTSNSFGTLSDLKTAAGGMAYHRLSAFEDAGIAGVSSLPFSVKVLLESVVRSENGREVKTEDVLNLAKFDPKSPGRYSIPFLPARVLMQDFTGVPAVVDLAALRSAMHRMGRDPQRINPILPVDLVIDHSVQVDSFRNPKSLKINERIEFQRNRERYEFLRWGQTAFRNFRVVPPGNGICHQVNLEYLAKVVQKRIVNGRELAFPDSLVGTDSHTTMIGGLGVLGWGVGGIEAEAAMLGQPLFMLPPEVVGVRVKGSLPPGATATDLVLTVTEMLRKKGVVDKFVEFFGPGLRDMPIANRATISNMAPEFGARCAMFPVDDMTLIYLRRTGRGADLVDLVERYGKEQGLFRTDASPDPVFTDVVELDLGTIEPSVAGPKRPQDRVPLAKMKTRWRESLRAPIEKRGFGLGEEAAAVSVPVKFPETGQGRLRHGDVVIAAITSCTNTSNPYVMIGAGLLAKKAVERGLIVKPFVKTSLAPGSKVVTEYLDAAGLTPYLDKLGFNTVGYGCTTCIGNSGPLPDFVAAAIDKGSLVAAAVLSGNRNFEGRVHPRTRANYLMSPILVVAFALAGTVDFDFAADPLGQDKDGKSVFLADLWPSAREIEQLLEKAQDPKTYAERYGGIEQGNDDWNAIPVAGGAIYDWNAGSSYIQEPPFFKDMPETPPPIAPIENARVLVHVGDSVTTDHISPAGSIPADGPAGKFLIAHGVKKEDFNSFGSRRGNDRVMTRGTFANIRIRNKLAQGREGGYTTHVPTGELMSVYDAAMRYRGEGAPVIVLAGRDYGMGSSRDWAAKGANLLGVKAVIARSFEIIHRSNLIGMGVLPLQFKPGESPESLGLTGREKFTVRVDDAVATGQDLRVDYESDDGRRGAFTVRCRLESKMEIESYRHGGILHMVLRVFLK